MRILSWGNTDVGRKREHNEDSLLVCPDLGLFAVADGMGGHQGGDRASRLAVEILEREVRRAWRSPEATRPMVEQPLSAQPTAALGEGGLQAAAGPGAAEQEAAAPGPAAQEPLPARQLRTAASMAGRTIFNLAQRDPRLTGMGTTLTALYFHQGRAYLAHVGDSRAYLFRDERIEQLTNDHSWIEEQVRGGFMTSAEAQESSLRHIITRSVGFESDVEVDLIVLPYLMGDCFLLCSDGLSNLLSDEELRQCMSERFYGQVPRRLIEAANAKGGDDNITAVMVCVANDKRKPKAVPVHEQETAPFELPTELDIDDEFDPYAVTVDPDRNPVR